MENLKIADRIMLAVEKIQNRLNFAKAQVEKFFAQTQ